MLVKVITGGHSWPQYAPAACGKKSQLSPSCCPPGTSMLLYSEAVMCRVSIRRSILCTPPKCTLLWATAAFARGKHTAMMRSRLLGDAAHMIDGRPDKAVLHIPRTYCPGWGMTGLKEATRDLADIFCHSRSPCMLARSYSKGRHPVPFKGIITFTLATLPLDCCHLLRQAGRSRVWASARGKI
jgi:hypothetical protein